MASVAPPLPQWDMSVVFPDLQSPQFEEGYRATVAAIDELAALFDRLGIGVGDRAPRIDEATRAFDEVVPRLDAVLRQATTLYAYINAFVATDSRDVRAQAALSRLQSQGVVLAQLGTRFAAWSGSLDVDGVIAASPLAAAHAYALQLAKEEAGHLMSPAEEALAAELSPSGGDAWSRLHQDLTSQIAVRVEGQDGELPMSAVRNLAYDPDRQVRRRAYEAELAAWERHALPLAAALNSIKGETNTLGRRRRWPSALDRALASNHIDRQTLDAMLLAARESLPTFRRYLRAKARALGLEQLAWYDVEAPIGAQAMAWSYEEARALIEEQFAGYSPKMRDLARRAFADRWIDAGARPGKVGGGFCMGLRGEESRILVNYTPAFDGVSTLAHELGHAYHNLNIATRTMLQRNTPMTLAETASTFCETVIRQAGLARSSGQERLGLLEASLQGHCQIVVDIYGRFLFEQRLLDARQERELSIGELNAMILQAQGEAYGDGIDPELLHPYMWAVKGHYYSVNTPFYNFPYMFGALFGLGLYRRFQQDPGTFRERYDDLLSATGMADAASLAGRFGIDIRSPQFWRDSLAVIGADIEQFVAEIG